MDESTTHHIISRRAALRAGGIGVGVLWVAPVIQVVGMTRADAASDPPPSVRDPHQNQGNQGGNQNQGNQGGNQHQGNHGNQGGRGNHGG